MNTPPAPVDWRLEKRGDTDLELVLAGDWDVENSARMDPKAVVEEIRQNGETRRVRLTARDLGRWDSLLMIFLIAVIDRCREETLEVDTGELPEGVRALLNLAYAVPERAGARRGKVRSPWLAEIGNSALRLWDDGKAFTRFLGEVAVSFAATAAGRARFRNIDLWLNIQECGPSAVPIVTLISLLVGLILAFVGAVQLALFGAQIYIADLVALGMTREMGALMTAIIMAGRTGASFAAQIGTMNVNQEISALRVMGFAPLEFLVLPRMLALILVMPVLCLYADLMGIIGGGLITISFFDVSLTQYIHRTREAAHLADVFVGLAKCTVFGVLIAVAGCMRGMQCGRSASAVGDAATSAVVTSIVFIVVSDSIITLICDRLGI